MPDISSPGIFYNKTRMLNCSSSIRPSREAVPESFILHDSHHLPGLGNKSDAQLCPLACQSHHLSDRQVGREQSPFRIPTEIIPFLLELGSHTHELQIENASWFSGRYLSRALGTVFINMIGEVEKRDTKLFLRTMYTVILLLKTESIHNTFHFTWPAMLSSGS